MVPGCFKTCFRIRVSLRNLRMKRLFNESEEERIDLTQMRQDAKRDAGSGTEIRGWGNGEMKRIPQPGS